MSESAVRCTAVWLLDSRYPDELIYAELRYDTSRPYSVCLAVGTCDPEVCWYFGRDLLADGRNEPSGEGDVRVAPGPPGEVLVRLGAGTGTVVVSIPLESVNVFLTECRLLVPPGSEGEHLDIDAALERLLGRE
ncbi:SsgA family sporulation/cell division regulator [Kitasatospora camelliae]|uniref:SsgA family sporulation/cell division regulator n=1 Tax=Kitasatospora camelliae TaxID=3156397 RepID=A0AAU8JQV1_9ACTN